MNRNQPEIDFYLTKIYPSSKNITYIRHKKTSLNQYPDHTVGLPNVSKSNYVQNWVGLFNKGLRNTSMHRQYSLCLYELTQ